MAVDSRRSKLEDPFADFSLLSLLPRTLGVAPHAGTPPSEAQEMESIKALLDSIVLNGSKEVLEQAQAINKSFQNLVNSSRDGDKTVPADGKDRPCGRRPALGRKRAQFSLRPISSNPVPDVDFNSQIHHLDDPEEYFLAFEHLENADKVLKKLRGEVPTEPANNQQITARKRRPGILGKTSSYKHQFFATVDSTKTFSASQEDLDARTITPSKASTRIKLNENLRPNSSDQPDNLNSMETNDKLFVYAEQEDSLSDKEKNANDLLEKLLTSFKDLDEGEGTALLRESLQIKSIEVEKIHLPEFCTIQRGDFRTLDSRVMRKKLEVHQLPQNSPTLGRSPLAAISNLQRRISLNDPLENPYMIPPSDDAPYAGYACPTSYNQEKSLSPPADISYPNQNGFLARDASVSAMSDDRRLSSADKLQTSVTKADKVIDDKIATVEGVAEHACCSLESTTEGRCHRMIDDQSNSDGFNKQMEEGHNIQLDPFYECPDPEVEDPASECTDRSGGIRLANTLESTTEDHMIFESDTYPDKCHVDCNLQNQVNVRAPDVLVVGAEAARENSTPSTTVLPVTEQSKDALILAGENIEAQGCRATSVTPQNNKNKQKASPSRKNKRKMPTRRQSLAGAGMIWESGVRRSTRIKSRPLQYWRGERFLYGRIHDKVEYIDSNRMLSSVLGGADPCPLPSICNEAERLPFLVKHFSLATVIGVKYASPGKDAELKVKSFVPEQYADLVAHAALH